MYSYAHIMAYCRLSKMYNNAQAQITSCTNWIKCNPFFTKGCCLEQNYFSRQGCCREQNLLLVVPIDDNPKY
jgi:hypothetical protein